MTARNPVTVSATDTSSVRSALVTDGDDQTLFSGSRFEPAVAAALVGLDVTDSTDCGSKRRTRSVESRVGVLRSTASRALGRSLLRSLAVLRSRAQRSEGLQWEENEERYVHRV